MASVPTRADMVGSLSSQATFIVLRHNGETMKKFDSVLSAKEYAQGAFESMVRYSDDAYADMAMAA